MTEHVLCAVDLTHSDADKSVLETAAKLADLYGATLSVVTVIPDYGMSFVGSFFPHGTMKKAAETASEQLHKFVSDTLPDTKTVQHIVEIGSVYENILDAIERSQADLVVIGAHKPDLVDRLQGPNSARVVRHAPCSVFVVR
ncbi:MAG: universal stress protein [Rhodobacteraceae bacterium]|nr:universal stress protein [Paracoccaceae bacterium]